MTEVSKSGATAIGDAVAEKIAAKGPGPVQTMLISAALGMILPLLLGAMGYGAMGARVDALADRVAAHEARMDRTDAASSAAINAISARFDDVFEKLSSIKEDVATIRARTEERRR